MLIGLCVNILFSTDKDSLRSLLIECGGIRKS